MLGHQYMEKPVRKHTAKRTESIMVRIFQNDRILSEMTFLPSLVSSPMRETPPVNWRPAVKVCASSTVLGTTSMVSHPEDNSK
jgi:hypothetical protein